MNRLSALRLLISITLFLMMGCAASCQNSSNNYKISRHADNVWTILETVQSGNVNIYVIEGKDSALIVDTGYGSGNLKEYLQTLTKLPLIIVNTHGHRDHTGGDRQFLKVYLHPDDFYMVNARYDKEEDKSRLALPTFVPVKEGHIFDLGGRKLEVIEVPGHTHGSIVLLDKENKLLFSGDNTNSLVWLFLKDCYPLEIYLKSLEKVEKRVNDFDTIMPGHNTPLGKTFISEQIACVKTILDGTCTPVHYDHPFNTFGALECDYKTAKVTYDPNNLRVKK